MLLGGLDAMSWYARGFANVLLVPLLLLGARRLPNSDLRVFVSRQVTFYTTTFLAAGVYLLLMSLAGYAIRELGGALGRNRARRVPGRRVRAAHRAGDLGGDAPPPARVRQQTFLSQQVRLPRRVAAIHQDAVGTSEANDVQRASVQAVAQTLDSPGRRAVHARRDRASDSCRSRAGRWRSRICPASRRSRRTTRCVDFMRARRWIVDLHERRREPARCTMACACPPGSTRSALAHRLADLPARRAGRASSCCSIRRRRSSCLSRIATCCTPWASTSRRMLAQHEADRRVAELSQFETYNRLTAFVMHDLKNCAAQLSLVVGNAVKHRHNPEFIDDAIATIANTSERMTRLIEQLSRRAAESRPRPPVRLAEVVVARGRALPGAPAADRRSRAAPNCACMVDGRTRTARHGHRARLRNAQDATPESGSVSVDIADAGRPRARSRSPTTAPAWTPEFVQQQLFRPFHSTKGSKGMGIGAYQARELARSLGGDVEVESRPGAGTRFSFILPVAS